MSEFYDSAETRSDDERAESQFKQLRSQLKFAKAHSSAYAEILQSIDPATIVDAQTLASVPLTRKSELIARQAATRPFGGLAAARSNLPAHTFASPGPIYEPADDTPDYWRFARALYAAGVRADDLLYNTFSYHFTPAGQMLESGARALGCGVVAAGPGQTELQLQTINDLSPTVYVGTASFLRLLLDKATEQGAPIACFNKALVSGEALPETLREGIRGDGIALQQCYASADVGLIAYESPALSGMIVDEGVYVEIVRPGTGEPLRAGEVGEVVVTLLSNSCYPLIRFATGDLSAFAESPSACGRTNRCIKGWMGRADQTTKVRGMFVHPEQIDKVQKRHAEIIKSRLIVSNNNNNDEMLLLCESAAPSDKLCAAVAQSIRDICKLRGAVKFVAPGSLANDGKVIEDARAPH